MEEEALAARLKQQGRTIEPARAGDDALGPLKDLPGTWSNQPELPGHGWNMIAVPFAGGPHGYRLLLNQYNETLSFKTVDKGVPNRGIPSDNSAIDGDQFLAVLDYEQNVQQIAVADSPASDKAGAPGAAIHHEPGLWMHILNKRTAGLDIARLATVPHGDSVLALGRSSTCAQAPAIPNISGLPVGVDPSLDNPYLQPYRQFHDSPFENLFDPVSPNDLLNRANQGVNIARVTELSVHTSAESGGVVNVPFIVKQANATEMTSTFWIQELEETDADGKPKLRLQYTQTVLLEFFPRQDGAPGLIRWPHVSINTLVKVS